MNKMIEKCRDNKEFYLYVLGIAVPMIIQNLITNFVSMLDNIMVGRVGTLQMSGVSIVNQFVFIFNITIFGAVSGASIFGTQFYGKGDREGQRYTFRYRLILCCLIMGAGMLIFQSFGNELIGLFLSKDDSPEIIADTLKYGREYLSITIFTLIPFSIGQAYSSVVRESGETRIQMFASMAAIGINLALDYTLIFGKFGCPELGVAGAALATLIAKTIEALTVIIWTHSNPEKNPYIVGAYKGLFHIPIKLVGKILTKSFPLLLNEFLWALGMSVIAQCYSVKGIHVVAARNIASTITNLFGVIYLQLGVVIGIIVGAKLGAGLFEEAKSVVKRLTPFVLFITVVVVIILIPVGFIFPQVYRTETVIKDLSTYFIVVQALAMPLWSYANLAYFTLRSGGKIGITFLFDSGFTWIILIPIAYSLTHFTKMDIHVILVLVSGLDIIKAIVGYFMIKSEIWVNNIVNEV